MKRYFTKSANLQIIAVITGMLVSGVVLFQGLSRESKEGITQQNSIGNLKNTIKEHKGLIVNSYLLGLSIFKEVDAD